MDAISYSYADKQAKRIKKIIADPDSTSGIVTVPKTIASGENITVPAGRVAVLPNVQVDGTLNVQGDVFIPSGATLSGVVEKVTSTDNAIVRFDGTTGKVQNSGVIIDDSNNVGIGTSSPAYILDARVDTGSSALHLQTNGLGGCDVLVKATRSGPAVIGVGSSNGSLAFATGTDSGATATERMRIDSNGNVGIGVTPSVSGSTTHGIQTEYNYMGSRGGSSQIMFNAVPSGNITDKYVVSSIVSVAYEQGTAGHIWKTAPSGTAGNAIPWTNAMTLDSAGNLRIGSSDTGINNTFIIPSGEIQSVNNDIAYTKLKLNPSGGNVLIGTATDNGVDKLQVNGSATSLSSKWKYSDLNNACTVNENTIVNNFCLNIPYNDYGYVSIIVSDANRYCMQTFVGLNGPVRMFVRVMAGGNWSAWAEK